MSESSSQYGPWPGSDQSPAWPQAQGQAPAAPAPAPSATGYGPDQALVQYQAQPQAMTQAPAGWIPQAQPYPRPVAPKNGGIGVLLSFFIPGLGSMVNGSVGLGLAILGSWIVSGILSFFLIGIPLAFGVWIWGMIDGHLSAQRWNRAHGIIS